MSRRTRPTLDSRRPGRRVPRRPSRVPSVLAVLAVLALAALLAWGLPRLIR